MVLIVAAPYSKPANRSPDKSVWDDLAPAIALADDLGGSVAGMMASHAAAWPRVLRTLLGVGRF
jgi:hypothetical protein